MKRLIWRPLLLVTLLAAGGALGHASLYGPWRRFRSESLGFQVPYVDDWKITELQNCVVFAMQLNPEPYVRLAVGRVPRTKENFERSVRDQVARLNEGRLSITPCDFEGHRAFRVEGSTPNGRILDYYVDQGPYRYWISFIADRADLWDQYAKSFQIILHDFRFL